VESSEKVARGMSGPVRIFLSALLFAVVSQLIHGASAYFSMNYYTDPAYFGTWSKIMMPAKGPPPPSFLALGILIGFVIGFLYTLGYLWIRHAFKGGRLLKGISYGFLVFLIGTVPGLLALLLLINLPKGLLLVWAAENLLILLVGGIVIAFLNRP